jgi:hypothetical protein
MADIALFALATIVSVSESNDGVKNSRRVKN